MAHPHQTCGVRATLAITLRHLSNADSCNPLQFGYNPDATNGQQAARVFADQTQQLTSPMIPSFRPMQHGRIFEVPRAGL